MNATQSIKVTKEVHDALTAIRAEFDLTNISDAIDMMLLGFRDFGSDDQKRVAVEAYKQRVQRAERKPPPIRRKKAAMTAG